MEGRISTPTLIAIAFLFALFAILTNIDWDKYIPPLLPGTLPSENFKKFSSRAEFEEYLQKGEMLASEIGTGIGGTFREPLAEGITFEEALKIGAVPERVSQTTVQVLGVDEPDIVKTNGQEIYFSSLGGYYPLMELGGIMPPRISGETKIIKAFPPASLEKQGQIEKTGDLLLAGDILVIFSGREIYGYDVSNPASPQQEWKIELADNNWLVGARLYEREVYLITRTAINAYQPCPIRPLLVEGTPVEIKCVDIYHPVDPVPVDVAFTAWVLDPSSGEIERDLSFVGSSGGSVLYMSENAIYSTYSHFEDFTAFYLQFFKEKGKDIIPSRFLEKLERLITYDISQAAKMTEFNFILQSFLNSLDSDERLKVENELTNRMEGYYKKHRRDLEKTGIVKINIADFQVSAFGEIPGRLLNQFSLDQYNGYLRIATTAGDRFFGGMFLPRGKSVNDVYVLDKNLKIAGKIQDLGLEEKIYSVRFVRDKGYLVTFKQIDPFFVLDLSNPQKPALRGELKIPGYSSYLHPISENRILGVGKESSRVKISLFDVRDPEEPAEIAKYTLDEFWSDVLNTHHAFLLDKKHQIFFLPGGRGGYVFSYQGDGLSLVKAVSGVRTRRAVYIEDYLYVITDNEIIVLNELNWQKVNSLEI